MAKEPQITITGFLSKDPEVRFTPSGASVTKLSVPVTPSKKVQGEWVDGDTMWFEVSVWNDDHIADAYRKGTRVTVTGRFVARPYQTRSGDTRVSLDIAADDVTEIPRDGGQAATSRTSAAPKQLSDPWGAPAPQQASWGGADDAGWGA